MGGLEFKRTKVLYLFFLLVLPDITVHAQLRKKLAQIDAASDVEIEESIRKLLEHIDIPAAEKDQHGQVGDDNKSIQERGNADKHLSESKDLEPSRPKEKRWASAIIRGTILASEIACLATIASNAGCGGLQKTVCRLRRDVQARYDRLQQEITDIQKQEKTYHDKRGIAEAANEHNEFILRKISDSIDIAEKYLKLLAKVEQFSKGLPVLPEGFYTLDTRINSYIIDFEKVPDTATSPMLLTAASLMLGFELLAYVGKAMYKSISKMKFPKAGDFDVIIAKGRGKFYGVKGNGVFRVDSKLKAIKRASFKDVGHFRGTAEFTKIKAANSRTFQGVLKKVGKVALKGLGMVGVALCGWQIVEMIKANKEAEIKLEKQKKSLDDFLVEVNENQIMMNDLIDNTTELVGDYGNNFKVLVATLVSSKTFKLVASQSERDAILNINSTDTVESNIVNQQGVVYNFVNKYYDHMRNEFENLLKVQHVTLDVEDSVGVDTIKQKLDSLGITVNGKLEIFQIIARVYKDKSMYDGVDLKCIRNGKIKTEADLTKKNEQPVVSQDVASQIEMLATMGRVAPDRIAHVVKVRFQLVLTNDQILAVVARETTSANYTDRQGETYDLTKYRKSSSC